MVVIKDRRWVIPEYVVCSKRRGAEYVCIPSYQEIGQDTILLKKNTGFSHCTFPIRHKPTDIEKKTRGHSPQSEFIAVNITFLTISNAFWHHDAFSAS